MKWVKSLSRVWLFVTPWTVAYQASLSIGFSRQEHWSGLPFPSPGDLPDPGIEPGSPALEAEALNSEPPGKPWFSSVQSLSHVRLFVTPWITARQASLFITNSRSSLRLASIESVMPSSHLILFLHWHIGHLLTWGVPLSVSYHFAFSYCSRGSQGKNTEVLCHSLLLSKKKIQMCFETRGFQAFCTRALSSNASSPMWNMETIHWYLLQAWKVSLTSFVTLDKQ